MLPIAAHHRVVPAVPDPDLVDRIAASTGLSPTEAARVVEDVVAFHAEPVEAFVRRRHAQLKTYGARNLEIFGRIADELADRVVAPPELTERQLRRIVYG
jgi:Mg2+ and Co2+ transporter CorA